MMSLVWVLACWAAYLEWHFTPLCHYNQVVKLDSLTTSWLHLSPFHGFSILSRCSILSSFYVFILALFHPVPKLWKRDNKLDLVLPYVVLKKKSFYWEMLFLQNLLLKNSLLTWKLWEGLSESKFNQSIRIQ